MEKLKARFSKQEHEKIAAAIIARIDAAARRGHLPEWFDGDAGTFSFELGVQFPWCQPDAEIVQKIVLKNGKAAMDAFKAAFDFDIQADIETWLDEDIDREDFEHTEIG